jgi:hypothetical protein
MICSSCGAENDESAATCVRCGRSLSGLAPGSLLESRYEILEPLGQGGMGVVYKAHDRELDETVALKVLRPDLVSSSDMAQRFRSEIKLARRVRHRNVCGIHEYGQDGPLRFIVMEFVEGVDVRRVVKQRGALPPEQAVDVARQVAEGLQAIHDVGIVHRDLKTANLMLDTNGVVRLMDFGIAKRFDAEAPAGVTVTGQIIGTPEYMSPEQAQGEGLDSRSDVYALGIVLFELLMGRVPFRGATPVATIMKQLSEPPVLDGPEAAAIPIALVPVLRKALAKSPGERYASAREMAAALAEASVASPPSPAVSAAPAIHTATAPLLDLLPETAVTPTPVPARVATGVSSVAPMPAPAEVSTAPVAAPRRGPSWGIVAAVAIAAAVFLAVWVAWLQGQARVRRVADTPAVPPPSAAPVPASAPVSVVPSARPTATPTEPPARSARSDRVLVRYQGRVYRTRYERQIEGGRPLDLYFFEAPPARVRKGSIEVTLPARGDEHDREVATPRSDGPQLWNKFVRDPAADAATDGDAVWWFARWEFAEPSWRLISARDVKVEVLSSSATDQDPRLE